MAGAKTEVKPAVVGNVASSSSSSSRRQSSSSAALSERSCGAMSSRGMRELWLCMLELQETYGCYKSTRMALAMGSGDDPTALMREFQPPLIPPPPSPFLFFLFGEGKKVTDAFLCSEPLHHRHTKRQPLGSAPGGLGKARQVSEARGPLVKDEQQALIGEQAFLKCWHRRRESASGSNESKEKTSRLLRKNPLPPWGDSLDDLFFFFFFFWENFGIKALDYCSSLSLFCLILLLFYFFSRFFLYIATTPLILYTIPPPFFFFLLPPHVDPFFITPAMFGIFGVSYFGYNVIKRGLLFGI